MTLEELPTMHQRTRESNKNQETKHLLNKTGSDIGI